MKLIKKMPHTDVAPRYRHDAPSYDQPHFAKNGINPLTGFRDDIR